MKAGIPSIVTSSGSGTLSPAITSCGARPPIANVASMYTAAGMNSPARMTMTIFLAANRASCTIVGVIAKPMYFSTSAEPAVTAPIIPWGNRPPWSETLL